MSKRPDPIRRTLLSSAFLRGEQPLWRSLDMASHLIDEVAQWGQGTLLDVVIAVMAGQVRLALTALGPPQPCWEDGIRHHGRHVVTLTSRPAAPPPSGQLVELVRNPSRAFPEVPSGEFVSDAENESRRLASLTGMPAAVWPAPRREGGAGLLDALLLAPGSFVRILLGPADPIEQWMVQSAMQSTYVRVEGGTSTPIWAPRCDCAPSSGRPGLCPQPCGLRSPRGGPACEPSMSIPPKRRGSPTRLRAR